jgi:hypothetical protein
MRVLATWICALGLAAAPIAAARTGDNSSSAAKASRDKDAAAKNGTGDAPANASKAVPAKANPAKTAAPAKPAEAEMETELQQLRDALAVQAQQLQDQQKKMQQLEDQLKASAARRENLSASGAVPGTLPAPTPITATATSSAAISTPAAARTATSSTASAVTPSLRANEAQTDQNAAESPLQFKIGRAYITPVGFMDFTGVVRSTDVGSGIGTNFAGIPYGTSTSYQNSLTEFRQSMQNSRLGVRIDAEVGGGHVLGYWESDFLGAAPTNVQVSSNSNTFRSRLFWVDYRKGAWEFLGGQTWSLATPNRVGVSPLPGDVFFSDNFDTNYQLGNVWGRIPEFRVAYHFPEDKAAFAVAISGPDQYMGGTNGSTTITLPACCSYYANGEVDAGAGSLGPPNRAPDVIAKFVVDPSKHFHGEIGGIARFFQTYNQTAHSTYTATGGAGFANLGFDVVSGLRLLSHNYWSDGGGRYIFGQAPDFAIRADGSPVLVHSGSTVDGFEFTRGNNTIAAYYGLVYISRDITFDTNGCPVGWGYYPFTTTGGTKCAGSSSGQNRNIQEGSIDYIHTFWKNPRYGALTVFFQYSYLTRNPWNVAPGQPSNAYAHMGFFDLRYTLPGSAPTLGKY